MSKDQAISFDEECLKSLSQFTKVLKSIVVIYDSRGGSSDKTNPMTKMIQKFERQLIEKEGREFKTCHAPLFRDLYFTHRQHFLDLCEDSAFIKKAKVLVWFGKDDDSIKKQNLKLPIYVCYEKAKEMHDDACRKIKGEDEEEDAEIVETPEYTMYYELLYYLLDCICRSLECTGEISDLKSLRKSLKELREDAGIDDNNEVPGNSLTNIVRTVTKLVTGKDEEVDERQVEGAIAKAGEMLTSPALIETAGNMFSEMKNVQTERKEGQSITEFMTNTIQRLGPVLEATMPSTNEPVPEGVTLAGNSERREKKQTNESDEEIEIIKKK
jgi:hypothetical protein